MEESYLGKCQCIHCHEVKSYKGIFVHVDRAHLGNTKYSSGNNGKYEQVAESIKENTKQRKQLLIDEYLRTPSYCSECKIVLPFERRKYKFCSHSCSATNQNRKRSEQGTPFHSDEARQKISESITRKSTCIKQKKFACLCKFCGVSYEQKRQESIFCSRKCQYSHKAAFRKDPTNLKEYRIAAAFRFNLADYPTKYDFQLVEKHGWYAAKNRGDNLYGVSRDHIVSVKYGFENNIDPKIISHPANCRLMVHSHNVSKQSRCDMTVEELVNKINQWESE